MTNVITKLSLTFFLLVLFSAQWLVTVFGEIYVIIYAVIFIGLAGSINWQMSFKFPAIFLCIIIMAMFTFVLFIGENGYELLVSFLILLVFSYIFSLQNDKAKFDNIFSYCFYGSSAIAAVLFGGFSNSLDLFMANTRLAFETSPISLSALCCIGLLGYYNKEKKLYDLIFIFILLWGIVVSASKGPILAFMLVILLSHVKKVNLIRFLAGILLIAILVGLYLYIPNIFDVFMRDNSIGPRVELIFTSIDLINYSPIFGISKEFFFNATGYEYPHNVLLELWLFYGFLPFLLTLFILCTCILKLIILGRSEVFYTQLVLFIFFVGLFSIPGEDILRVGYPIYFLSLVFDKNLFKWGK